ncbi:AAA family ATPase [uncultured Muribaculum sp.]|uniref:AAA family ATPase n=1 Tax=uncultured Muribaculum sp. TaxID=1918613 RepID=UPI0025F51E3B|nr:ATP-binding protein [uncultured Muribaculum sp.]
MKLKKFSFANHKTGWHVKDVRFGALTLLVGASGVGKTQILKSLSALCRIAEGNSLDGREWAVEFEESGINYIWTGRFEASQNLQEVFFSDEPEFSILEERLATDDGTEIFSRNETELRYHDTPTVKLDPSKSAVELLKEEPDVAPVKRAFKKMSWLDMGEGSRISFRPGLWTNNDAELTLKEIKGLKFRTPIERLFLIQKNDANVFSEIKRAFIEIFPLVEDLDFDLEHFFKKEFVPVLKIKEKGVDSWIKLPDISSGMCRTLSQIVTLTLADDGDIILIDEFENGLGINCIDSLADMALEPEVNVQIIMTSHHPYIINSIPYRDWRIVSRIGGELRVHTASEMKIGEHSRHDAFMQLIQTSAYRTGQL